MIKIGDFANIFDVSIKTVRFYEEKGLLNPAYVDIYTGYRYYDDENIKEMSKIITLKNLGLELKEINNLDNKMIQDKILEYENSIKKISNNIDTLKTLSINDKGEIENMKEFINDENAIGKWHLIGIAKTKEDYLNNNLIEDDDYRIKELYLMPKGLEYWVISWSKGYIKIANRKCPYEIEDNKMYVKVIDINDENDFKTAIYQKIDNKKYSLDEIRIKDDINKDFIKDNEVEGYWKTIDFINNKESLDPNNIKSKHQLSLEKLLFTSDGELIVYYRNLDGVYNTKYTKDYIINLCIKDTLSKYEIKTINDKKYLIIEWKSGDYIFGGFITGYYVLEKID